MYSRKLHRGDTFFTVFTFKNGHFDVLWSCSFSLVFADGTSSKAICSQVEVLSSINGIAADQTLNYAEVLYEKHVFLEIFKTQSKKFVLVGLHSKIHVCTGTRFKTTFNALNTKILRNALLIFLIYYDFNNPTGDFKMTKIM